MCVECEIAVLFGDVYVYVNRVMGDVMVGVVSVCGMCVTCGGAG